MRPSTNAVECPDGPDGMTVQFNLAQPEPAFVAIQAYNAFSVLDSEYAIANGMWDGTEATWTEWIGRGRHPRVLGRQPQRHGSLQTRRVERPADHSLAL